MTNLRFFKMHGFRFSRGARDLCMVVMLLTVGCAVATPPAPTSEQRPRLNAPTRLIVAVRSELKFAYNKLNPAAAQAGGPEMEELINAGLTNADRSGVRHPRLAEATPTLENGLWKVSADGTMETT